MKEKGGNLKKIVLNTAWMLFDKVFILILNLIVTVRIANYYGSLGYGTYQYAVSIVALFEVLLAFIDSRVVKKRYSSVNADELVWNATLTRMIFSLFTIVGGTVYVLVSRETQEYNVVFFILLANSILINLRFGMQNRYEYLLKSRKVIIASNLGLTVGGILQLVAVHLRFPIIVIAILTAFSSFICLIVVYIQYRMDYGKLINGDLNPSLVKVLIIESLPLAIAASCAVIYSRCDSIMIGNMLSKEDVGKYAIAVKIVSVVQIGIVPVRESVYPKMIELYKTNYEMYKKRYIQVTSMLTWIYILGVALSFLILPFAFQFLNPEYSEAFPIFQVYVIGTFFMYNAGLRAGHYTLINQGKVLMYSQLVSVAINLTLNLLLIKAIGLYGAAIATCITQAVSLLFSNLFFGKEGRQVFIMQIKGLNPIRILR